jgi:site-specific DNA-methyltransferase (adenine-specific)
MINQPIPRLDRGEELRENLLANCRLEPGQIWTDSVNGHRVGCLDASSLADVRKLCGDERATLAIHDLPYNFIAFEEKRSQEFISWCRVVVNHTSGVLADSSSLYLWIGADQRNGFTPLPELMLMMRESPFTSRSFITVRNQRGYGTQNN